jgi:ribosomal protein L21E
VSVGSTVEVVGLQSQPLLNGKVGVVEGFKAKSGRYTVAIKGEEKKKNVKPMNLKRVD